MTSPVVHNYARALVELMKENDQLNITGEIAKTLLSHLEDQQFTLLLRHPKVPPLEKKALIRKLLPSETPREIMNFFNLIIDRRRLHLLTEILKTIHWLCILEQGYETVTFISAKPLLDVERRTIISELEALWQIKIYPEFRINSNILGGIIIQRGDKLYDGSLVGRLNEIKAIF